MGFFRMAFEAFIAWRYFKAKRKQAFISLITFISLAGVAVGVTALIVVLAVMNGVEETWKNKILGVNSHIVVLEFGQSIKNYDELTARLRKVPGVTSAEPFIYSQVMVSAYGGVTGAILRGVDPNQAAADGQLGQSIVSGRLSDLEKSEDKAGRPAQMVILGKELAGNLGIEIGDTVNIISPLGRITPLGARVPVSRSFAVAGFFKSGMYEYDSTLVYLSLKNAQDFLNLDEGVTGLELRVDDIYRAGLIKESVLAALGADFWARDWMQMNHNLFWALKLEKMAMFVILMLIVLVAAFNIISTLIMVVMEKSRDIAILKSMGATDISIMKIFVLQGLVVGVTGVGFGILGGVVLCRLLASYQFIKLPSDIYYIDTLPVMMESADIIMITMVTLLISFLATLYPAWRASRLNPVEALRYE